MDLHCKYFEEKEPIWDSVRSSFPGDYAVLSPADLADLRRIAAV